MHSDAFNYWTDGSNHDGSNQIGSNPDAPSPEQARPFVVCGSVDRGMGMAWRPINVIVFARDEAHACARVRAALDECRQKDYKGPDGHARGTSWLTPNAAHKIVSCLADGSMQLLASPYDITVMSRVEWASNAGVC